MKTVYSIAFLLITLSCFSQQNQDSIWQNIELSLRTKNSLNATGNRLQQLKQEAIEKQDDASLARAYCYLMLLKDQRTEDSLYFRNSAFIDSILLSRSDIALKGMMHYLQAQRLWKFKKMNLQFNRAAYETKDLPVNYAALSPKELDSLINYHFEQAVAIATYLQQTGQEPPVEKILWLSSTPASFLFTPSLTDVIYSEQISYYRAEEEYFSYKYKGSRAGDWLSLSSNAFMDTLQAISRHTIEDRVLPRYYEWIKQAADRKNVQSAIEFSARQYLYQELEHEHYPALQKTWEVWLNGLIHSEYAGVKAAAIFNLCFLYKQWAEKYPSQYGVFEGLPLKPYDTAFQFCYVKAIKLYEKNKALFERFSNLKEQLDELNELRDPFVQVNMNYENVPVKPILVRLEYKNTPQLYYRIVRIGLKETIDEKKAGASFAGRPVYRAQTVALPLPEDYNLHRTFLKIDPLPAGRYCLLFSYDAGFKDTLVNCLPFLVTSLAVINSDERVYVLDRSTGMPVVGASVNASYVVTKGSGKTQSKDTLYQAYTTDAKGALVLPKEKDYTLLISHKGDSLLESADVERTGMPEDVYTKSEYDDLVDYYDENTRVEIYTDRSIYRPGQTVFFKAVFLTKNPKTGETCLLNEANLKRGFNNWLKKWIKEEKPELLLKDPYRRKVDSFLIRPDSYGAVSGSFKLPRNAPTGDWDIAPDYLDDGNNSGAFRVEEYKRPTFGLTVSPPEKTYKFGDTLCFALTLKSFSGSTMNNIPVTYSIERTGYSKISDDDNYTPAIDIIDTTAYTDAQGRLFIPFTDTAGNGIDKRKDIIYTYRLEATATDATGESHEVSGRLEVATRPVKIQMTMYAATNKNDLRPLVINTKDVNGLKVNATLEARLYRIGNKIKKYEKDYSNYADQWLYDRNELANWFGEVQFRPSTTEQEELIFETTLNTGKKEKFRWPMELMATGSYRLEVTAMEEGMLTGTNAKTFSVFEPGTQLPTGDHQFFQLNANYLKKGDTLRLFSGSDRDSSYRIILLKYYSLKGGKKTLQHRFIEGVEIKGIRQWTWKLPDDVTDRLLVSEVFVAGNKVYHQWENVTIATEALTPSITVEQFRSTLTPGAQTTYAVSIKTNNKATAAQLMTVIYDASLDKLNEHRWQIPYGEKSQYLSSKWTSDISYDVSKHSILTKKPKDPLELFGRVPGVMVTNATGLNETIVVGYGGETTKRLSFSSVSTIRIRGVNSMRLEDYKQPLIILDGVPYTGELSSLNIKEITGIMVLKDADATAIYGSQAAGGVLLLSTKGEIKLPVVKKEPVLKVRSNFNETAFFAPAIYANKEGLYTFTFTTPESLTEWNWKLLAHTRKLQFAYAEKKLVTQLPLMIQPQLPTHLYQADRIIIKSRIANLDTIPVTGKAQCSIEDAVTGSDLTALLIVKPEVGFEAGAQSNAIAAFELKVPDTLLHPIKIRLTATTVEFADGEEHELPILSRKLLVKQNQTIVLKEKETSIPQPAIKSLYGVELSVHEKPQAALLQSLPFLANYSYNCAEQLFNRMYAHIIALQLMRKDTVLRKLYHAAIPSAGTPAERPTTALAQETMPWLNAGNRAVRDQEALLEVLDTVRAKEKIGDYLEKIRTYQNSDGGLSWFPGANSNIEISFYMLARFGALYQESEKPMFREMEGFINNLIHYCNNKLSEGEKPNHLPEVYYYYALSFWKQSFSLDSAQTLKRQSHFREYWREPAILSLKDQALLCLSTMRYFQDSLHQKAIAALQSIKERAIVDTVNGTRWKELAESEDIGSTSEETIAYLLEAFKEAGEGEGIQPGVMQWLLTNKQQHQWRTTTGTAAIISVLLQQKGSTAGATNSVKALLPDTTLKISDGLLDGRRIAFHESRTFSPLVIQKAAAAPVNINLGWYYFTAFDSAASVSNGVRIQKTISRFNEKAKSWERVGETDALKLGEKVRITLAIETPKALRYVFINDQKAAAFEPTGYQSGYNRGSDFSYYESIRDAGRQFFVDLIPSGRTQIEYEVTVAQEGSFNSGITSLECMYRPEISAYGNVQKIMTGN
jgi:TonB-dependent SusC/RagA subfamily outer membrane receptor